MKRAEYASLVILNAKIATMNPEKPKAEAVAVKNTRILAIGTNAQIRRHIASDTVVIDAEGKTVTPGLVDTHVHMTSLGLSLTQLNLRGVTSIAELQQRLREYSRKQPRTTWIIGRGWDQERFREKRYPTRHELDEAENRRPVLIVRVCGHLAVANTKALQLARVTKKAASKGSGIEADKKTGELTGILREKAIERVWRAIPEPTVTELEEACLSACAEAVRNGLTMVHWIIGSPREYEALRRLRGKDRLPIRVYVIVPVNHLDYFIKQGLRTGSGDEWLKIGCCKVFADGSLGARTALLSKPYADDPENRGVAVYTQAKLNEAIAKAHAAGFQVAVHAIGDKAIDMALTAFEKLDVKDSVKLRRHRVEHASVLNAQLLKRMRKLGLVASLHPHFIASDFWVSQRLGWRRARWTYPFKTIVNNGITAAAGSDSPVEPINPLRGVWAAVTRKSFKEERLSIDEALRMYTANGAYACFEEKRLGTVEAGKFADLVILSEDLEKIAPEKLREVRAELTIINGAVVDPQCSRLISRGL